MTDRNLTPTRGTELLALFPGFAPELPDIERAILLTIAYADLFEYPLKDFEIHRYLVGIQSPLKILMGVLNNPSQINRQISRINGYFTLAGRESLVDTRTRRSESSNQLWPKALAYGRGIANLPFVRMVGLTGALAVNNVGTYPDIDYLIVTEPQYLWICRLWVIALVRLAALRKDIICPNYFISTRAMVFEEQGFYAAHELTQMVPLAGHSVYRKMRALNLWSQAYLPNAAGPPRAPFSENDGENPLRSAVEMVLRNPIGAGLEKWEMNRKFRKFNGLAAHRAEANFSRDWCKGHFDDHGQATIRLYEERLNQIQGSIE